MFGLRKRRQTACVYEHDARTQRNKDYEDSMYLANRLYRVLETCGVMCGNGEGSCKCICPRKYYEGLGWLQYEYRKAGLPGTIGNGKEIYLHQRLAEHLEKLIEMNPELQEVFCPLNGELALEIQMGGRTILFHPERLKGLPGIQCGTNG